MKFNFYFLVLFMTMAFGMPVDLMCQNKLSLDPGADFVSRYIWRGSDFGNSPAIQPKLEMKYSGFKLGAWGSYSFSSQANFQEVDLYMAYTLKELLTITITDYFLPDGTLSNNKYFNYDYNTTGHVFEATLKYEGTENLPLSIMAGTNFAGADARTYDNKLQYSTYVEIGYSLNIKETRLNFFLGGTPTKPDKDKGETGYYGPHNGIINIGATATKEIRITEKFSLPVFASLITNPQQQNIFIVFGFTL